MNNTPSIGAICLAALSLTACASSPSPSSPPPLPTPILVQEPAPPPILIPALCIERPAPAPSVTLREAYPPDDLSALDAAFEDLRADWLRLRAWGEGLRLQIHACADSLEAQQGGNDGG